MKIQYVDEIAIVLLPSKFDTLKSEDVELSLMKLLGDGTKKLLCDFSKTEYIASSGLRVILSVSKKLHKSGGKIVLSSMKPLISEVFKMAAFDKILAIYETRDKALETLNV